MIHDIPDPYARPSLKRGVYPEPSTEPGWVSYIVVGSDGALLGRFGMRASLLQTSRRIDNFERRLRKFLKANDIPNIFIMSKTGS